MMDLRPHRVWIGILALACVIAAAHAPLIGYAQQKAAARLAAINADYARSSQELEQLQADIAATEKLKTQIDESETEKSLAPIDRLRAARILERRAAEARLSNFSYTLSAETKTPIDTVGAGQQELTTSKVTLSAEAPTDLDVYVFLDTLRRTLPGRFTLRSFSMERIGAAGTPISATNLKVTASGEWLSNGAPKDLAENTP